MCTICIAQPNTQQAKDFHTESSEAYGLVAKMLRERQEAEIIARAEGEERP